MSLSCALSGLAACGGEGPPGERAWNAGQAEQAFINGGDDRREYFELTDPAQLALMQQSVVVLMAEVAARQIYQRRVENVLTWGETNALCPDEPFADQPSASFCSGVLVDWDLVLTSGHCVNVVPLRNVRVAFGYYWLAPEALALSQQDVYSIREVVAARDDDHLDDRLDFAWLRLTEPVRAPHRPAVLHGGFPEVVRGEPIVAVNAGGGVPLKLDAGGSVRSAREQYRDYFVVDTDTSEGSSGGPAFNEALELVGTLARGAPDFVATNAGCLVTDRESDPELAREQFTYVSRSVQGLCEVEPDHWLCDTTCDGQCEAPPPPPLAIHDDDGCSLGAPGHRAAGSLAGVALALAAALRRRRALTRARS